MSYDKYVQQTACALLVGLLAAGYTACCADLYINDHAGTLTPVVWSVLVPVC